MRFIIIIAIFFLASLSIQPIFSQSGSRNIMEEYCQKNWEDDLDGCSDYIVDGNFTNQQIETLQKPTTDNEPIISDNAKEKHTPNLPDESPLKIPEGIVLNNNLTMILLGASVVIGFASITTYKIFSKRNQKQKESEKKYHEEVQRVESKNQRKLEEERQKLIQEYEKKQREGKASLDKEYIRRYEEKLKKINDKKEKIILEEEKSRQKEIEVEKILEEKIKNHEDLYSPADIEKLKESATIRVFYDLGKKDNKYWKETGLLDRIHSKDSEIREELKVKQNKITLRISVERGDDQKFAKLISGGTVDFWDHDSEGYYLQVHISKTEEFLKLIIIKNIRTSFPNMRIFESSHSITAILLREKADYEDASNVLKRITKHFCDELNEMGDVLIEK